MKNLYQILGLLSVVALAMSAQAKNDALSADRDAILAMQGEYSVGFNFRETVALEKGYRTKPPKNTGAYETVIVVENSPKKIVLQHILVADSGHVTKHWRQDWFYEAKRRQSYQGDQIWKREKLDRKTRRGAWTQCVYEVSDAPRYCGTGRWVHNGNISTWESDRIWRPLPRREYTTRKDYNVLEAVNRHTVTPSGWTHEQDNSKIVVDEDGSHYEIVRESGLNTYRKIQRYDFTPAYDYWEKTKDYWAMIRGFWRQQSAAGQYLLLDTDVSGMAIIIPAFGQAQQLMDDKTVTEEDAKAVIYNHTLAGTLKAIKQHRKEKQDAS